MSDDLCLVLDIGGTNTRIALTQGHTLLTDRVQKFANADYPNLAAVIETYLGTRTRVHWTVFVSPPQDP